MPYVNESEYHEFMLWRNERDDALNVGQSVIYTPYGEEGFCATVEGYVEGWPNLRFRDGSTCIVRPSRVKERRHREALRENPAGAPWVTA